MAGSARFTIRMTVGGVLDGLRLRSERLRTMANEASYEIAAEVEESQRRIFPQRVSEWMYAYPYHRAGGLLNGVKLEAEGDLPRWYILGTRPHNLGVIYPREAPVLAFYWRKLGQDVVFASVGGSTGGVQHPGARPHTAQWEALVAEARDIAYERWSAALATALGATR